MIHFLIVSTEQSYGECFFSKLRGGVSEILKHPITVNLSIAQFESNSIIHLQFSPEQRLCMY